MMFRAAIILIALAAPAIAQRGGAHAGSFGSRGFAGHAGFSGSPGFSQSASIARPAQPVRYGALGSAGLRRTAPPNYSRLPIPYSGNRFVVSRPPYRSEDAGLSRAGASGGNRGRDPYNARRRSFERWYLYNHGPDMDTPMSSIQDSTIGGISIIQRMTRVVQLLSTRLLTQTMAMSRQGRPHRVSLERSRPGTRNGSNPLPQEQPRCPWASSLSR